MEFQAETRKLLDIVTHSIYTDKEVFIRELISNASDALEKYRYKQVMGEVNSTDSNPLEISIIADPEKGTLIVSDNGIGMTKEELISNLGTIARSGSKQFVEQLKGNGASSTTEGIIGQFGVGFYSSFMVAEAVSVESISVAHAQGGPEEPKLTHKWSSDGSGVFKIEETINDPSHLRGSRIVMQLKESCKEFANEDRIKE
jgi:HSP90 family molecular chaperone